MGKNYGFAVSGILYTSMLLFLLFLLSILGILGTNKVALDKIKSEVILELSE